MPLGTRRDPALTLLLIFATCGLYYLYFIYKATEETQEFLGERDTPPALAVVLHVITCGIYNIYWDYQIGKRTAEMCARVGLPATDNSVLYLVLDLLGVGGFASVGLINPLIQQDLLNKVWEAAARQQPPPSPSQSGQWPPAPSAPTPRQPRPPQ